MANNELRTIEVDIFRYNYLVREENQLEIIKEVVKEKENSVAAIEVIKAILGVKETGCNG